MVAHGASASTKNPFTTMVVIGPEVLSQTFSGPDAKKLAFAAFARLQRASWASRGRIERVYLWERDVLVATGEKVAPLTVVQSQETRPVRPYGEYFNRKQPTVYAEDLWT